MTDAPTNVVRTFQVSAATWETAREKAAERGDSLSALLRSAVEDYVADKPSALKAAKKPARKTPEKKAPAKKAAAKKAAPRKKRAAKKTADAADDLV